jgi:hypothetical protein
MVMSKTGLMIRRRAGSLIREASVDEPIYSRGFTVGGFY